MHNRRTTTALPSLRALARCAALVALVAALAWTSQADAQFRDGFEGPEPTWRLAEADCGVKVLAQQRALGQAHGGNASEYTKLAIGNGTYVYMSRSIGRCGVIAELAPSMWLRSDRANIRIMMRVVLPRSIDPGTGQPITTLLRGDTYTDVGNWQQLSIPTPLTLLNREAVVLRTQFGRDVDLREAYADLLVLNTYTSPGETQLWFDDLEIGGYVNLDEAAGAAGNLSSVSSRGATSNSDGSQVRVPQKGALLEGSILTVGNRPFMPRAIQYQGEPLEWLKSLGFNTIKLASSPPPQLIAEARRLDMWIIAPPPYGEMVDADDSYDRILAWSLGSRLGDADVRATEDLATELRRHDKTNKPTICSADCQLSSYSRIVGIVQADLPLLGSTIELASYRSWLASRPRLMRPGTPLWAGIAMQSSTKLDEQLRQFSASARAEDDPDPDQLRLQVYAAVAAGVKGLVFQSNGPLAIDTVSAGLRTDTLKLVNHELSLIEPWVAGGSLVDDMISFDPTVQVSVLQTERSKLLVITRHASHQQYVAAPAPSTPISIVVPGVPISDRAYQITLSGLKQLRATPGSGGTRITIEDAGIATAVVLTQDPLVIHHLHRTLTASQQEVARLRFDMAVRRHATTVNVDRELAIRSHPLDGSTERLDEAQSNLEQARRMLESGNFADVHRFSTRAESLLARVRRGHWEQTTAAFPSPAASPCISRFSTLPLHWSVAERIRRGSFSPNYLAAGDMENLRVMLDAGWRQQRRLPSGIEADVALSIREPHSGRSSTRLAAWVANPKEAPAVLERPPVWITSSPVPVKQGQIVRVHGWVNVPARLIGTADGLHVFDSVGGPELGDRIRITQGWREFTLYRSVPENGQLTLTFALTGLGEASIDSVSVHLLDPPPIRPAGSAAQESYPIIPGAPLESNNAFPGATSFAPSNLAAPR